MPEFVRVGSLAEMPPEGEAREFDCGANKTICIARVNGELAALDNVCIHRGGPLGQGVVMGDRVVCPWHGWEFDLKTGAVGQKKDLGVQAYRLKIVGEDVMVEL